ncbi:MAG: alpha/beta fold hydrolase [Gammaproteobacteria bacterium]|nr:bifunctional alpha/beta hydrolase/OsmC family protein [Gammaproteobacteria bacterium]MBU6509291.1 bifunctional alpha/beta hydrolase/OsmC family protein [Gammaproteobacteria bacterium]MDE1983508.1 alpha/beta fold hydrolase [Gammaproteobacteria bacterium]MDE2107923.1 alpha/beta fold hydrolase [Gammaproteobacteria bacterium]MDE2460256.1 alpha/beta fold hydrolase [Gammaproteobacteria bacterium]
MPGEPVSFPNAAGQQLAGRLEMPLQAAPRAFALYAHCFTCGKDVRAAVDICRALCARGIAVLRFDFTGLGESQGNFADTTLSSNISDLVQAAKFLEQRHAAPKILVGHSLGGTAALEAAHLIPSCIAVATVAAPANPEHVANLLGAARQVIEQQGEAEVLLAGRKFHFKKAFLDDLKTQRWQENIHELRKPLLIFHSPTDATVDISNAGLIFAAALHPKSFVSLSGADHLLSRREDSEYVGLLLAAWASKYLGELGVQPAARPATEGEVVASINREHYHTQLYAGAHTLVADEPRNVGGTDSGPSPYGYLTAALGACTAITLRMYADRKQWPVDSVSVRLKHDKIHASDCADCETKEGKIDRFTREIELQGNLSEEQRQRLLQIANKCPVHQTLESEIRIETSLKS